MDSKLDESITFCRRRHANLFVVKRSPGQPCACWWCMDWYSHNWLFDNGPIQIEISDRSSTLCFLFVSEYLKAHLMSYLQRVTYLFVSLDISSFIISRLSLYWMLSCFLVKCLCHYGGSITDYFSIKLQKFIIIDQNFAILKEVIDEICQKCQATLRIYSVKRNFKDCFCCLIAKMLNQVKK